METKTIFVHDPYDVFLAVGFGFCYASAILPAMRMLERHKRDVKHSAKIAPAERVGFNFRAIANQAILIRAAVIFRGFLTIIGLACLYGWYAYYLKSFFRGELPAYRIILDWCGLGLFAIGANWWDNEDHHENLYCLIQGLASLVFGATCFLALPSNPDARSIPLLKAIYWCVIIASAWFFYWITTQISAKIFNSTQGERNKFLWVSTLFLSMLALVALADWALFSYFNLVGVFQKNIGRGIYAAAIVVFIVIVCTVIMTERKAAQSRFRSMLLTFLPMGILIWVTYRNCAVIFP